MSTMHLPNAVAALIMAAALLALAAPARAAEGGAKVAVSATADLVAAENAHLRIEFSRKDGVIRLARLVNKSNKRSVLEDAGPLWSADTASKCVLAGDAPAKAASLAAKELPDGGARLSLRWESAADGMLDVEVTVDVAPGSRETLWRIHPAAVDKNAAIKMVHFPVFEGVGRGGKWDRLVRPTFVNERMLNPGGLPESKLLYPCGGYPGVAYYMPFVIYEYAAPGCTERATDDQKQGGGGLYIAAYDPLFLVKEFSSKGLGEGKGTSLAIGHFAEGLVTDKDGKPGLGFPCAMGVFDGGYWGGLDLYRDWARGQAWCAAGPIRKRANFPKKLLNSHINHPWGFDPADKVLKRFKELGRLTTEALKGDPKKPKSERVGMMEGVISFETLHIEEFTDEELATMVPATMERIENSINVFADPNTPHYCIQWYRWHSQPFDYAYPDYFPLRPGWLELRAQLEKAHPGYFVHMPYINGRCAAEHSELWTKNKAVVDKWSTGGSERWHSSDFSQMCPHTEFWQNTLTDVARRIFTEAKADGLYIDQLGYTPIRCMKTDHGHKPGDPASWVRGQQTMLRKIRAAAKPINPDAFFTTEFFAEPLVGLCEGFLTYAYSDLSTLSYVYGEYAILHGHARSAPIDENYSRMDCAMVADMFISGAQFGWLVGGTGDSNPQAYQKKLVPFRPKALPYLLLPMVRPLTGTQTDPFWTSLRKGDSGEAVVIATNPKHPTAKPPLTLDETFELDCKAAGLKPGRYRLKAITQGEEKDLGPMEVTGAAVQFRITLEPQESAIYILEPLAAKGK